MTRDLGDLMWGAVGERSQSLDGLTPDAGDLARLRSRVRRGRTARHVREGAVAVPVVAALVAVGWFGLDRMNQPDPPPATQEPVVPTPDDDGTDDVVLGEPIDEPGLPTYYELPDGLLEQTGPGWLVTVHRPSRHDADAGIDAEFDVLVNAMFLVAPDGTHFLVGKFDADANVYPVAWRAGSPTVDVVVDTLTAGYLEQRPDQDLMAATYDLRTRAFTEREGDAIWPPDTSLDVPRSPSGRGISIEYADTFTLSAADGGASAQLGYAVPGKVCSPVGWLGEQSFLALCLDASMLTDGGLDVGGTEWDYHPVLVQVDLDGARVLSVAEVRTLAEGDPLPSAGEGIAVRDGVVAFRSETGGPYGCWTGVDLWTPDGFQALQRPEAGENSFDVRVVDGVAYVQASPGCTGEGGAATLTAHELTTGGSRLLEPAPADWRPGEPGTVWDGLIAWTVAE